MPLAPVPVAGVVADSGQAAKARDEVVGATLLHAFELPPVDDTVLSQPRLTVAAAGTGAAWRGAALLVSGDDGASWQAAGASAAPATMGTLLAAPGSGPATLVDEVARLEVLLAHDGMALADADDRQLDAGANLALVGEELIQFGRAEPLGEARWRLSRLLRGRRGTEAAIGRQAAGDRFVLLEAEALRTLDMPLSTLGTAVRVMASGVGDTDGPVIAVAAMTGASVRPPSPVGLVAEPDGTGGAVLRWQRRSRLGWRWLDGADVPLGEEAERYRVTLTPSGGGSREVEIGEPTLALAASELADGPVTVGVRQRGTCGESDAAMMVVRGEA